MLVNLGFRVSGSDQKRSGATDRLQQMGVTFAEGHNGENIGDAQVVVRSTAVRDDNSEIIEAHQRSIPVIPRRRDARGVDAVETTFGRCGSSHGKTTYHFNGSYCTGTCRAGSDNCGRRGCGCVWIECSSWQKRFDGCEADESDRSFLMLTPTIAVVTNIDREHMDYYHDMDDVRTCFTNFVNKVPFYGASVLCLDDPNVQAIIPHIERRRMTTV